MIALSQLPGITDSERLRLHELALDSQKLPPRFPSPQSNDMRTSTRMQQIALAETFGYPVQETK